LSLLSQTTHAQTDTLSAQKQEDFAAKSFLNRCSGCHAIGDGKRSGPDLLPSTKWAEPELTQAIQRMQRNVGPLSTEEIRELVDFLKSPNVQPRLSAERQKFEQQFATKLTSGSAETGRRLFAGTQALQNGGMACMACHQVAGFGGAMAIDLTQVHTRISGTPLISAIQQSSFNIMRAAYRDQPITQQEAVHLTKFFEQIGQQPPPPSNRAPVDAIAAGLALVALFAIAMGYRQRNRGVRSRLIQRAQGEQKS
jgi:cytochrome c553